MESLQAQGLIISQQLAKLRSGELGSVKLGDHSSTKREQMATSTEGGNGSITSERLQAELAWEIAETAQSCVYLAEQLQLFAERYLQSQTTCPESICKLQLDSAMTLHDLLRTMRRSFEDGIVKESVTRVPRISMDLVVEIRLRLAQGRVTTMDECMINTESQEMTTIEGAGGTS
jgi:hypothetical protein